MRTLISGGAGSGKSALAEELALRSAASPRVYVATMQVWSEEDARRVERHRRMRAGKGFTTLERASDLAGLTVPQGCVALLEDLGNLTANECFGPLGFDGAEERILEGIHRLSAQCRDLIVVTNELFSDGMHYPPETARYLRVLARLNCELAASFDRVAEVAAGLPIVWKGALE